MIKIICIKDISLTWYLWNTAFEVEIKIDNMLYSSLEDNNGSYDIYITDKTDIGLKSSIFISNFYEYFTTVGKIREDKINEILND